MTPTLGGMRFPGAVRGPALAAVRKLHGIRYPLAREAPRLPARPFRLDDPEGVLVAGAGLAGLAAAHRLAAAGRPVRVLEARERPGGRVWTLRETFGGELPLEAGAARFPDDHHWTRRYLRRFGVPVAPFYPTGGRLVVRAGGRRRVLPAGVPSWRCHAVVTSGQDPGSGPLRALKRSRWYGIPGGADGLVRSMAEALGARVRFGIEVREVARGEDGVRVACRADGRDVELAARRLVCSLPMTMLRSVEMDPPLPSAKRRAVRRLPYESALRVFVRVLRCPWREAGLNGFGWSEGIGEVWQLPVGADDTAPGSALVAYARGTRAARLSRLEAPVLVDRVVDELDQMLPGVAEAADGARVVRWDREPWSLGAQSRPWDVDPWPVPELRRPVGPLHFAGEHVASAGSVGWMDGALESGWRAADAVLRSL